MKLGKPSQEVMRGTIGRLTGATSAQILVGPKFGIDVSALRIDNGKVMIVSCDPLSLIPSIGAEKSAVMSLYEVASDVATSGISPGYAAVDLNLPPHISDKAITKYWRSFHEACVELGMSIVGGHTGRFEGCDFSVVGSATLWAFCGDEEYVTSGMAEDGDDLILTKSAAYGATSVLTRAFPHTVKKALGTSLFESAWKYFRNANIVKDALTASSVGIHERGVTAMHDATEGGIIAALHEIASASGLGGLIDLRNIPISDETTQLCKFFRIDPLISLGEGSLVIASKPDRTKTITNKLDSKGINATVIGRLSSRTHGVYATTKKGRIAVHYPTSDPYWRAYWRAVRKGWS